MITAELWDQQVFIFFNDFASSGELEEWWFSCDTKQNVKKGSETRIF